jgi:acyl-CoA thioesterase-1
MPLRKVLDRFASPWLITLALHVSVTAGLPPKAVADDDRPRIVAFGNSLTAGFGVAAEEAYPARLQRRLDEQGYHYRVINAGVSGDTTAGGLRRVDWVLKSRPEIVILELGGNDGLRGLNLQQTKANLAEIIQRCKEASVRVILAGMKLPPNYGADYTKGFEAIYPALAKQYGLILIPFFLDGVAGSASLNQADGIHPTSEGYRIITDSILETVKPMLNGRK